MNRWSRSESPGDRSVVLSHTFFSVCSRHCAAASQPSNQDLCVCPSHRRNRNPSRHSLQIDLCLFCCCQHIFHVARAPFFKTPGHLVCRLTDSFNSCMAMTTSGRLIWTYLGGGNDTDCQVTQLIGRLQLNNCNFRQMDGCQKCASKANRNQGFVHATSYYFLHFVHIGFVRSIPSSLGCCHDNLSSVK